ncbi:UNVERIFIED_CONTAM: hypothetical protein PYX00_005429 [Menopon gallinae]
MVSLSYRSLTTFISDNNLPGLRTFLESRKSQVDDRDDNNSTALIYAASRGKAECVRELLRYGADVNAEDADSWTALLCAAKEGYLDVCKELLDHDAEVDHRDIGSWTPLLWATYKGRTEVAELLIERGADVNAHENYHICPLHWACGRGHTEIARMLLRKGVKVNVGDKYGTTALVWACRKGYTEIVDLLLKAGANVDTAGMYSWTPLLVATAGNHVDIVNLLLEHKPNVNAPDKDGCTALALACKEGYYDIVVRLLAVGAYINIQDRSGDTNLILAVKGGHRNVVEALLKKYADIDTPGKDKKTAIYSAVEKGNVGIVKLLLNANPDLEVTTKDGDTALLRAVRSRNAEIVSLLLDKKAKVSAADAKGDTALHIAMRARSKVIVEILLRNPKNSQLLYRPNRNGETPYNIDINQQKTILGQIFGARRLNTNEDNENLLGYDLYSSALADILSEPSLSMPITVGLYAKWGSGKSFLLNKLREEMKNFARQWVDPSLKLSSLLFVTVFHIALIAGVILGLATFSWIAGVAFASGIFFLIFTFLLILWCFGKRYDWNWPYQLSTNLARQLDSYRLILQVMFCHPPGAQWNDSKVQPIRFNFTDQTRISSTTGGENSVVLMLGSLYDSIENDYGNLSTRLYRAFRPKSVKAASSWKWRKACCVPHILIFELALFLFLFEICLITIYFTHSYDSSDLVMTEISLRVTLITIGTLLAVALVANTYTLSHMMKAIVFSQRRHLQKTISKLDTLKSEGFIQALKGEVTLMTDMVKCLDSFTKQQTRLVIVVDGLDSCEQDKVLMVLDAIHMLFSDANAPFIVILAIDPHIISKAVELNSRRLISESNIGGHEYLRNMVHLPFFLANSALRKVKVAQATAMKRLNAGVEVGDDYLFSISNRRLSIESNFTSSTEKLKPPSRKGSRKLKASESIASSIGSNLNRIGGAQDLTKMLLTDDYFSDVNPRSMRRLLNVVYVTGRLLKAFQMDFNWYHLAVWVNITEQWPYRTSWLIWYYELHEDQLDDQVSLKAIYDEVRPRIPVNKEIEPLLERDRDEKKFDIFLSYHRSSLLLSDMKVFLPFTINLDPYIKKVIKDDVHDERSIHFHGPKAQPGPWYSGNNISQHPARVARFETVPPVSSVSTVSYGNAYPQLLNPIDGTGLPYHAPVSAVTSLPPELSETRLSQLTVEGVCDLIKKIEDINPESAKRYISVVRENNVNGKVLIHCDMNELKKVMKMNFGDWELFKVIVISLREQELSYVTQAEEATTKNVRFIISNKKKQERPTDKKRDTSKREETEKEGRRTSTTQKGSVENQITLEDQMICGALQTLNEEACEDVMEELGEADISGGDNNSKETSIVFLQSSPLNQLYRQATGVGLGEDSSPCGSVCSTPVLQRKSLSRGSDGAVIHGCMKSNKEYLKGPQMRSRPSSLLLDEELRVEKYTPPPSPKGSEVGSSRPKTSSLLSTFSLKRKKAGEISVDVSPTVIITPVSSVEKLHKLKDKILGKSGGNSGEIGTNADNVNSGRNFSDDESTPLVSENQTPTHSGASTDYDPYIQPKDLNSSNTSSSEISPSSAQDTSSAKKSLVSAKSSSQVDIAMAELRSNYGSDVSLSQILEKSKSVDSISSNRSQNGLKSAQFSNDVHIKVASKSLNTVTVSQDETKSGSNLSLDLCSPETSV